MFYTPLPLYYMSKLKLESILKDLVYSLKDLIVNNPEFKTKLINIEGLDASGKHTQTSLLYKILNDNYMKTKLFEFPNYTSSTQDMLLLKDMLSGKFGSMSTIHPTIKIACYAVDRYNLKYEIIKAMSYEGYNKFIIFDRYNLSNVYNILDDDRERYFKHFMDVEFNVLGMPVPDVVFYLNSSIGFIKHNLIERKKRNGTLDEYEADLDFQKLIRERYKACFDYIENNETPYSAHGTQTFIIPGYIKLNGRRRQLSKLTILILILQKLVLYASTL